MSTAIPTPEQTAAAASQRLLACVLCQQRKVRCDRKFPCAKCVLACVQCVPAALAPRQRRRRFPERELLERLRHYEGLLRQNNIRFEPLQAPATDHESRSRDGKGSDSPDDAHSEGPVSGTDRLPREKTAVGSKTVNLWHAMSQRNLDPEDDDFNDDSDDGFLHDNDDVREAVIQKAWDQVHESESNDRLLFGSPKTNVDLSTLHPKQIQSPNSGKFTWKTSTCCSKSRTSPPCKDVLSTPPTM